jgi:hypothetical protein
MPYYASAPVTPLNSRPSSPVSSDEFINTVPEHLTGLPAPKLRPSSAAARRAKSGASYTNEVLAEAVRMVSVTQQLRAVEAARDADAKPTCLAIPSDSARHGLVPVTTAGSESAGPCDTAESLKLVVDRLTEENILQNCELLDQRSVTNEELLVGEAGLRDARLRQCTSPRGTSTSSLSTITILSPPCLKART